MKGLTKRQQEVLAFIEDYIAKNRYSPSYRDIMHHFGLSSVGSVAKHVAILKRKGVVQSEKLGKRSLTPTKKTPDNLVSHEIELPFIGTLSAHQPIETFPHYQTLAIPKFLVPSPEDSYVLRARGSSLHEEMICDGDLLIVEARAEAFDGETVIGQTSHHSTLLKKYHPEGNYVRLCSHSPYAKPLMVRGEEFYLKGVLISVLRLY